jgi:PHS family inorganic phosphate transporter-like MFS transporter
MPLLAFIYWPHQVSATNSNQIKSIALAGIVLGAVGFGHIADRYGRREVYGVGLLIVLISILGVVQSSAGFNNSTMSFIAWISFWQALLGLGIGAIYVSSAVITTEYIIHAYFFWPVC